VRELHVFFRNERAHPTTIARKLHAHREERRPL
jgi:hypothetical protein